MLISLLALTTTWAATQQADQIQATIKALENDLAVVTTSLAKGKA